ncbi:unnamed protein product [Bursaphelenchus okinawaensis]|uniref:ShKT domain-containing protein n=1 Tax=Bursaphelenchus okinawaensis TaxID=465554 RepID=A0A811K6X7_9BILA|nr:unnamed protein product [Bursaphelenchus okinawaensis]CAG9094443.1 unnamed protein product [Bursaphelenchus okinawaensis]
MKVFFLLLVHLSVCLGLPRLVSLQDEGTEKQELYETKYLDVKIDHTDFTSIQNFSLKYLVNSTHYKPGGPLFFYMGNEGVIEGFAENTGIMYSMAPSFNALIVFAEHRYYGNGTSMPFGHDSYNTTEHAKYLTTGQTINDFAVVIKTLRKEFNFTTVIGFGGSYGGMLAVWMREKFPHLVHGVWAASAPINQFRNSDNPPEGFTHAVSETLAKFGCNLSTTHEALLAIDKVDYTELNKIFNIPQKSLLKNNTDRYLVTNYVRNALEYGAMTVYPYPANFLTRLPAWHLVPACKPLSQPDLDTPQKLVQALYESVVVYYNETESCVVSSVCGDPSIKNLGYLPGWYWQTCTEIGMPMAAAGWPNDIFWDEIGNQTRTDLILKPCEGAGDLFEGYNTTMFDIDAIERLYGLNAEESSRMILTQGELDPWRSGRPTLHKDAIDRELYDITISAAAHHLDLRWPNTCDPASVVEARKMIYKILKCWTGQDDGKWSCDAHDLLVTLPDVTTYDNGDKTCEVIYNFDYRKNAGYLTHKHAVGMTANLLTSLVLVLYLNYATGGLIDWALSKKGQIVDDDDRYTYTEAYHYKYFTDQINVTESVMWATTASVMVTSPVTPATPIKCDDDRAWDCQIKRAQCHVPAYFRLMKKLCATTCRSCVCMDRDSRCKAFVANGFCNVRFYSKQTKLLFCVLCKDLRLNCNPDLCELPTYKNVMKRQCRRTCGYCEPCEDKKGKVVCRESRLLCPEPFFEPILKRYCAKSCNFCGAGKKAKDKKQKGGKHVNADIAQIDMLDTCRDKSKDCEAEATFCEGRIRGDVLKKHVATVNHTIAKTMKPFVNTTSLVNSCRNDAKTPVAW